MSFRIPGIALLAFALMATPTALAAQGLESLGSRATALSAFVAVADDASAVAWNPAGLVTGPIFNLIVDFGRMTSEPEPSPTAGRATSVIVGMGSLPAGVAYYRLRQNTAELSDPAVVGTPDRQDRQHVIVRTLVTNHFGATVQQSVGDYLTIGATLKLVRGSVAGDVRAAANWDEAFSRLADLEANGSTRGDVDVGAMFGAGRLRAGLVVRNVTAPTFGDEEAGGTATLERQARFGAAWGDGWPGTSQTVIAFDADLTHVPSATGDRRDLAAGVERWLAGRQVAVRGGVRASTIGDPRTVVTVGGSYAVTAGLYLDAHLARGSQDQRGWGVAARVTY